MSNFLRGGQVVAHKIRMFNQVMKILVRLTIFVTTFTFIFTIFSEYKKEDWNLIPVVAKDEFSQQMQRIPSLLELAKNEHVSRKSNYISFYYHQKNKQNVIDKFHATFAKFIKSTEKALAIGLCLTIAFFCWKGRMLKANNRLRGSFLKTTTELKNEINLHNRKFTNLIKVTLADIPYAATGKHNAYYTPGEQSHTLILGATGSGKTIVIGDLVSQLSRRKQKAIIVDIKGDYIKYFYDPARCDIILNPLDSRGENWSFFSEANILTGFDTVAKTLISDSSKDQFWINAARRVFSEMARLYSDENLSMAEFVDKILNTDIATLEKLLKDTSAKHLVDSTADKTVTCILMMLAVHLSPLKLYTKKSNAKKTEDTKNNNFSITNWINDDTQNNFLFISTSAEAKESLNPLVQTQVDIAINVLCSIKKNTDKQVWFILDELPYFDRSLPNLKDGLATSRSFGGVFVLGAQDMSSLSKIYGYELSRVIANNCRNKLIMNIDDGYTANWCSDIMGEGEVEEWQEGMSYGAHAARDGVNVNTNRTLRRVVLATEFSQLKTGQGYIKMAGFDPALINFRNCHFDTKAPGFIENTELKETLRLSLELAQTKRRELEIMLAEQNRSSGLDNELVIKNNSNMYSQIKQEKKGVEDAQHESF